jgi:GNAT superfamily N-acetyltransferase
MGLDVRPAATLAEVDAAYELAARVFGPDYFTAAATKVRLRALDPVRRPDEAIVVLSDGEVVGFVRLVARAVWLGGDALVVGGVTSVCVHPRLQKLGYGRLVMEEALAVSRARGDVLSIAFARRAVDGFYPRLGYLGIGCHPELTVPVTARTGARAIAITITSGLDPEASAAYQTAYRATYGTLPLAFAREAVWWPSFARRMQDRLPPVDFRTVRSQGAVVGYFVVQGSRVIEAAATESAADALESALATAGPGDLTLALPPAHPALAPWRRRNHTERIRYAWDGGHVARVLDARRFAAALADATRGDDAGAAAADARDHTAARAILERVAGVAGSGRPMIALPAWSVVDEF